MARSLIKLAQDETVEARRKLFAEVSRLVANDLDKRSSKELALFAEVMLELYSIGAPDDRLHLAQKVAPFDQSPLNLVLRIACDDLKVAEPVLARCSLLSPEDLLDLSQRLSKAHLQVLAQRTDLPAEVSDLLAEKGGTPVHHILAGNREIKLSRETLSTFTRLAADDTKLRDALALRSDLSPAACRQLLPLVDEETKQRLLDIIEGALSKDQLDQIARLKALRKSFGHSLKSQDVGQLWREAQRADVTLDELMILLLQDNRFNHAVELLSARGRIALSSLKDALFSGKMDVVLRTAAKAGLQVPAFALLAKARSTHMRIPSAQGGEWTSAYAKQLSDAAKAKENRSDDFQARRRVKKS